MTSSGKDFQGQRLRRQSFEGQKLVGADFGEADVRGCDFSNANLADAQFVDANIGVPPGVSFLILAGSALVSFATGVSVGLLLNVITEGESSEDWRDTLASILMGVVIVMFFVIVLVKGIGMSIKPFLITVALIVAIDFAAVQVFAGEIRFRNSYPLIGLLLLFLPAAIAGLLGRIVGGMFRPWAIALVAVVGGLAAGHVGGALLAFPVSMLLIYISKRALKGDERDGVLRDFAHRIVTHRATRFTGADVSGVDFSGTLLTHSDVSNAILEGAVWDGGSGPHVRAGHGQQDKGS